MTMRRVSLILLLAVLSPIRAAPAPPAWVVYEGGEGPGKGKHVVLISGDEEYRSEEALPQLGKILAKHHGFKCTVLFAIDKADGTINPNESHNIPGLDALKSADLMVLFTRFRDLPDQQLQYIDDYIQAGKPIIGLRTATHAFSLPAKSKYAALALERARNGRAASAGTFSARRGLAITAITAAKARAASWPRTPKTIPSSRGSTTAISGARPTFTACAYRCRATASRSCWAR